MKIAGSDQCPQSEQIILDSFLLMMVMSFPSVWYRYT